MSNFLDFYPISMGNIFALNLQCLLAISGSIAPHPILPSFSLSGITFDGDTVYVSNGIYYENVVVDKSISLIGEDRNTTVIDMQKDGTPIRIVADECLVSDFTILDCKDQIDQDWGDAVIKINGGNDVIRIPNGKALYFYS